MQTKENHVLEIHRENLKLILEGPSDSLGSNELKLRAIHALIDFDFKHEDEADFNLRDKYYVAILSSLGRFMKSYDLSGFEEMPPVEFINWYLEWYFNSDFLKEPEVSYFIDKHLTL